MKNIQILQQYIITATTHAQRIQEALTAITSLLPLTEQFFSTMTLEQRGILEIIIHRFCKLQDCIGNKIFPLVLSLQGINQETQSYIDRLHTLEKLNLLPSSKQWLYLRELRNHIAHEYPNQEYVPLKETNTIIEESKTLVEYWHNLRTNVESLISQYTSKA